MSEIERRHFLRKREKRLFLRNISRTLGIDVKQMFGSKPQIEVIETHRNHVFVIDGLPLFASSEGDLFPTLSFEEHISFLPKIVVDMGAIAHICDGADVLAPGIVDMPDDFEKEDLVVVTDERNRKPIAMARSVYDSKTAKTIRKGKMFRNLHHVGDEIWDVVKEYPSQKRKS